MHDAFTRWSASGLWPRINEALRPALRLTLKKKPTPARPSLTVKMSNALTPSLLGAAATTRVKIKRSDLAKGFQRLPRQWVVERTFGWLMKSRRLTRDHERKASHHEALVYLAMIGFAARNLIR